MIFGKFYSNQKAIVVNNIEPRFMSPKINIHKQLTNLYN